MPILDTLAPLHPALLAATPSLQKALGSAALLLIVGGLSILTLIVLLIILQSFFPARGEEAAFNGHALKAQRKKGQKESPPPPTPAPAPASTPVATTSAISILAQRFNRETERLHERRARPPSMPVDRALDRVVDQSLGDPRILRHRPHYTHVRLFDCAGCRDPEPLPHPEAHCSPSLVGVEEAFQSVYGPRSVVHEVLCTRRGQEQCEFEVRH